MSEARRSSPPLTEEEWIVLLDVYLTHRPELPSTHHKALVEASDTLGRLGRLNGRNTGSSFRPPAGLRQRMAAFLHLEKTSSAPGIVKAATAVWNRYAAHPAICREAAGRIRARSKEVVTATTT